MGGGDGDTMIDAAFECQPEEDDDDEIGGGYFTTGTGRLWIRRISVGRSEMHYSWSTRAIL